MTRTGSGSSESNRTGNLTRIESNLVFILAEAAMQRHKKNHQDFRFCVHRCINWHVLSTYNKSQTCVSNPCDSCANEASRWIVSLHEYRPVIIIVINYNCWQFRNITNCIDIHVNRLFRQFWNRRRQCDFTAIAKCVSEMNFISRASTHAHALSRHKYSCMYARRCSLSAPEILCSLNSTKPLFLCRSRTRGFL